METKICSKCRLICSKNNFHKSSSSKDGLKAHCKSCRRQYYDENRDHILNYHKNYRMENQESIKKCKKQFFYQNKENINNYRKKYLMNKRKTDPAFRLMENTRCRLYKALNGLTKSSTTKEFLGIDLETYRRWILWQMKPGMNWSNIQIDHVKPICLFDVSKDEELKEAFRWENTQPLLKEDNLRKKIVNIMNIDYRLQFIKAYQFLVS